MQSVELSLVLPCYNEEECLASTVTELAETFASAGVPLQLVLVDNGSRDRTSQVIDGLIAQGLPVTKGVVEVNQGQGLGILTGFDLCRGRFIGYVCADGQVSAKSVLDIYNTLKRQDGPALAKARRRFRQDGVTRKAVSIVYNGSMKALFPGMPSLDVNGNPKIMPADVLRSLDLCSRDWFLEAEVMLKIQYLRISVIEINVPGHLRAGGRSNVRAATVQEFIKNMFAFRFGARFKEWREKQRHNRLPRVQARA